MENCLGRRGGSDASARKAIICSVRRVSPPAATRVRPAQTAPGTTSVSSSGIEAKKIADRRGIIL